LYVFVCGYMCLFAFVCICVGLGGFFAYKGILVILKVTGILVILEAKGILVIWITRVN